MMSDIKIKRAFISVYYKDGLEAIVKKLSELGVAIISTGGSWDFITASGVPAGKVEEITTYPSILGGRVKTLHPGVFGGILARRENETDMKQVTEYNIPLFDLVIVDLYPFGETVASGASDQEIIEKIDIGGISLIRAGAKNWADVLIISSRNQYGSLMEILDNGKGTVTSEERYRFALEAFAMTSHYDSAIFNWFNRNGDATVFSKSITESHTLRYGENPHQKGVFFGDPDRSFVRLHGKEISYNNLLDIESAISLIDEFDDVTCAIIKHNNACGVASRPALKEAWEDALACDPVSAYGGVVIVNREVDEIAAAEMDKVFLEVVMAPSFTPGAVKILSSKKNRIILQRRSAGNGRESFRSMLGGVLWQERDSSTEQASGMRPVTARQPSEEEYLDMVFANKIVKHSRSNAIVLAKNRQLCASGIGQTSRIDALRQAIQKAKAFGFSLEGAVMASDAYFPFADSVTTAHEAGIAAVVQPGGSVRDQESIDYCNKTGVAMVFTGVRHFKH
ncbi:MAG: bifunctional phosphoribosylaminoimidazolecarboxamide formyltransferase/IMP cyclohydrolase [Bacteroidales bacterium]|jgi:phosphoribosylaminoimidazolecarboxamide formyltransferase/IMP cyclohydrolase|nr:bifunctional phosphoribosylaminoimidazolecarboxamide formyltransferase/IMP cyclohydrolase [Bacteroidales bacterium]MDX9926843.1 bifunctional phosphoribosylaminoimidazolecarboxamide formyltransferase/IMP cyclohydrolase [Bacteroidales bacterium]HNX84180.1 bifunctional phosphoribosylaminoimidazolecarboxamide formyltransferase/IMP cyclohydrolase [Bacteroidales bacterium]HOC47354.1 bifunctional phosphoribosylaminoimidazolecarboxamide formyltransferase/IMP cyclohydrolase [Bacteroidales bacterium]H